LTFHVTSFGKHNTSFAVNTTLFSVYTIVFSRVIKSSQTAICAVFSYLFFH